MQDLLSLHCQHYSQNDPRLAPHEITKYLKTLTGWTVNKNLISKIFKFKNYYQTIAFVNAVACIVHEQDHHPEIKITYNTCVIEFTTHSINALSLNDFICAAKINNLDKVTEK